MAGYRPSRSFGGVPLALPVSGYRRVGAEPAVSMPGPRDHQVGVFEGMAIDAMRLERVLLGNAVTAHDVLAVCDRLKMVGIHAASGSASVIQFMAIWNGSAIEGVGNLVS